MKIKVLQNLQDDKRKRKMKLEYEDCLNFIADLLHIKLMDCQKNIIKAMMKGGVYSVPRGMGVTFCTKLIAAYTDYKYNSAKRCYNHHELKKYYLDIDNMYIGHRQTISRTFKTFNINLEYCQL